MSREWVSLAQPLFEGMPRAAPHGDVRIWVDEHPTGLRDCAPTVARITHLEMAAHVGTHVDAANHFVAGGRTIDQYGIDHFSGPGVVLDVRRKGVVPLTAAELEEARPMVRQGDAVLLWFGYAERFSDQDYVDHPYLTPDAADWLLERGARLVGVDTVTPDMPGGHRPPGFDFPVHMRLLTPDVLIIENLGPGIAQLAGRRVDIAAAPFPIEGGDASPIAPVARVTD